MSTTAPSRTAAVQRALEAAVLAPSIHNTQPWRFVIADDHIDIVCDPIRQLGVLDPTGRQLLISVGCAVFNARVSFAADGVRTQVESCPVTATGADNDGLPEVAARITVQDGPLDWLPIASYAPQLARRHTNRRPFAAQHVTAEVVYALTGAAAEEGAVAIHLADAEDRATLARLTRHADERENADPAYRAELRHWTSDDPARRDGVPAMAVPHVTGAPTGELPIRDFDTRGLGWLPSQGSSGTSADEQCLFVLGTETDDRVAWMTCGQALEHLWLEATARDYVMSLFTQVIEVPETRAQLRAELALPVVPQVVLRVGRASTAEPSRRRRLDDLIDDRRTVGH